MLLVGCSAPPARPRSPALAPAREREQLLRGAARPRARAGRRGARCRRSRRPCAAAARRRRTAGRARAARCRPPGAATSGKRSDCRRISPVSIWRSSSSIRQRVTSHETNPSTDQDATTPSCDEHARPASGRASSVGHEHDDDRDRRRGRRARSARAGAAAASRVGRPHRPGRLGLAELGQPVAQPRRLVALEARDPRVARRSRRVHVHGREPERPLERPRRHVDELHAAVRDDREPRDEHAAPDEQVVLALDVAPGRERAGSANRSATRPGGERRDGARRAPAQRRNGTPSTQPGGRELRAASRPPPRAGAASAAAGRGMRQASTCRPARPSRVHAASMPTRSEPYAERAALDRDAAAERARSPSARRARRDRAATSPSTTGAAAGVDRRERRARGPSTVQVTAGDLAEAERRRRRAQRRARADGAGVGLDRRARPLDGDPLVARPAASSSVSASASGGS